jgi:hypothetical protein
MTIPGHLKFCAERSRLLDLLSLAASQYANAANDLSAKMGNLSNDDYVRRRHDVEHARMDAEHSRDALWAHRTEHGC